MGDRFTTREAAEEFVAGLQTHGLRAMVWDKPYNGLWRISAPDLDFTRSDRIWESAEAALAERLGRAA